jgi:hypothetical protein
MSEVGFSDDARSKIFEAMQSERPYMIYVKTIRGRVNVNIIDPIELHPTAKILKGEVTGDHINLEDISIKVWTAFEDKYLRMHNREHLEQGVLIPYDKEIAEPLSVNQISEDEIIRLVQSPFFVLRKKLLEFTSPVPVRRFLDHANRLNCKVKTINFIKNRLSELEIGGIEDVGGDNDSNES